MIVTTHGTVAAGRHVHRAAGHVGGLVGTWPGTLHGHVIWPWEVATQMNGDAPGKAQDFLADMGTQTQFHQVA